MKRLSSMKINGNGWFCFIFLFLANGAHASPKIEATVIDRFGNQHQVRELTYQGRQELEVYIGDQRRLMSLFLIDRLRFEGESGDEQQEVSFFMRSGKSLSGFMFSGGNSMPHQDAVGGGGSGRRFIGVTPLGPFFILLSDVREIIFAHDNKSVLSQEVVLTAIVITLQGKRYEVSDLRFRGKQRLDFFRGRKKRFIPLEKVTRIDFDDSGASEEYRPITAIYRSGRTVMGTVDASTVRLAGETDRSYHDRVQAALTGEMTSGPFSIGMHQVKQIRFEEEKDLQLEEKQNLKK
ncbi:MAG: hypothetical protein VX294_06530 [Candidatus Latescibacterota bacterium]|nr:hypothetical protein [Candidatus Latescibacterota bacterium]